MITFVSPLLPRTFKLTSVFVVFEETLFVSIFLYSNLALPAIETSAIDAADIDAATAAINNCFFILKTPKFYKLCKIILAWFLNNVVKIVRIIRFCF